MIPEKNILYFSKKFILVILLLSIHSEVFPQQKNDSKNLIESTSLFETKFEQLPTELGISNSIINCIVQDIDGFMWFPTTPGLIKFDGNNFKGYGNTGLLEDSSDIVTCNGIQTGLKDSDGQLWFGTNGGLLLKYNRDYDRFSGIDLDEDENGPYCGVLTTILEDRVGDLLIGTNSGGFIIFNKKSQTRQYYNNTNSNFSSNIVNTLYVDRKGFIYIGTEDEGLFIFDRAKNEFINYKHSNEDFSLSSNKVRCIFEDNENNIWIGTKMGLNILDRQRNKFTKFIHEKDNPKSISDNDIRNICEDKNNGLWIATFGGGLNKYEKDGTFTNFRYDRNNPSSLCSDYLYKLFVDNSNVLWIGTSNRGVCKFDLERKKFFTISRFFQNSGFSKTNDVSSIFMDSTGLFWIATRLNKGIFNFTKSNDGILKFTGYSILSDTSSSETITGCFEDKFHNIWFCGHHGKIYKYEVNNKSYRIYENKSGLKLFYKMVPLDEDHIFISTTSGFLKFDMNKKVFSDLNVKSDSLQIFSKEYDQQWAYIDKEKILWFDWGGLTKYEMDKDRFTLYETSKFDNTGLQGIWPTVCGEDNKGNVLIVTSLGLNALDKSTNNFTFYPVRIGGYTVEDESGNFWAGSDYEYGLTKFNPKNNDFRLYDVTDGLQGNRFNSQGIPFKDMEGTIYIGGPNGLTYFNPNEIKDNSYTPNIALTTFQIFNGSIKPSAENPFLKKSITVSKEITLSYKENVFSFEFAALIYNNPSKNQYAYMMEGFDKDWVYSGTRRNVTYTNLDPGEYTFRVKGSNNDGVWNEEGTSIKIIITPPWWQTWWFKSCGAALVLLTAGFGYKKRVNKLKKEKLAQEEYSRKLLSSQEDERKRIANELHDSIAHDILILKNDVVTAMNATKEEETKNALNKISDQSAETLNDVRNISYNLHPHQIEALGITKAIRSMIEKVSKSAKVIIIPAVDDIDKIFPEENEVHIYRIIQEAISNIIKHSDSSEAIIKVTNNRESVSILISDNGKGFDEDNVEKGSLGLTGIFERVKILGGTLSIESIRGEGTLLKILLPVRT